MAERIMAALDYLDAHNSFLSQKHKNHVSFVTMLVYHFSTSVVYKVCLLHVGMDRL